MAGPGVPPKAGKSKPQKEQTEEEATSISASGLALQLNETQFYFTTENVFSLDSQQLRQR